jgi:Uncharacterized protein conserved in bacteria
MKTLYVILGCLSLGLGVLGIFLPLLPTTPFLLLAAALFARSSQRLHSWLLSHPVLGEYIRAFLEDRSIPLRVKILSLCLLWASILSSVIWLADGKFWLQILLPGIAVGVSWHIFSYPTRK